MKTKLDYKYVVNGGNSGIVINNRVFGGQSACIRAIQFRALTEDKTLTLEERVKNETDPKKFFIFSKGLLFEEAIAKRERIISKQVLFEDVKLVHELDSETCISMSKDLEFGYDPEFEVLDDEYSIKSTKQYKIDSEGYQTIHRNIPKITKDYTPILELKGINTGDRARKVMVENGVWDENYLYQLGKYMLYSNNKHGILMYNSAITPTPFSSKKVRYKIKELDSKCFFVQIKDDSDLLHVGESYDTVSPVDISLQNLHDHTLLAAKWLKKENELYPYRPEYKFDESKYGCMFCKHLLTCNKYDSGELKSLQDCIEDIQHDESRQTLLKNSKIRKLAI